MKKLNKAFAVLTVLAMLATLFVAVPASAAITGANPTVNVHFTSGNTPDSAEVDPSSVAVGTVFYVWVDVAGFDAGGYVMQEVSFIAYDKTVEVPYNLKKNVAATSTATAKNGMVFADLAQYSEANAVGFYKTANGANFDDGYVSAWLQVADDLQAAINGGEYEDMDAYTDDTLFEIPATGEFTAFGWAFIKTAAGNSGITIAGDNKVLNEKAVWYPASQLADATTVTLVDMPTTYRSADGASMASYTYHGAGTTDAGGFIDNSPVDSAVAPTEEPTEEPTEAPTEEPLAKPTGEKQASQSTKAFNQNAFFYEFETPIIPGEVKSLSATFQIPGKDAVAGQVTNVNLTNISNVALNIAAVIKNIPAGQEDTPVTTSYILTYEVGGVQKTLEWSRTNSLN